MRSANAGLILGQKQTGQVSNLADHQWEAGAVIRNAEQVNSGT